MSSRVKNPFFARWYSRMVEREDPEQIEHRREMLAGISGRVLELGAGAGTNFEHFPETATSVTAAEPEPYLRERARAAAADARVPTDVVDAVADDLPVEASSFDAGVACLVLCTVPDQERALRELHRVLHPGGELRFYEHVHAHKQPMRTVLEIADRSKLWPLVGGGCHPTRETLDGIEQAGFTIERVRRFAYSPSPVVLPIPHVIGVARRL